MELLLSWLFGGSGRLNKEMPEEKARGAGTGFQILELQIQTIRQDLKDLRDDFKQHVKDNKDDHEVMEKDIIASASAIGRIEIMLSHIVETNREIKKQVGEIATAAGKDQGWRALITDIIKAILVIGGYIAAGKFF